MTPYLRLRQVCLAAPRLEPVVQVLERSLGLAVCHRDEGLAAFGLVNALFTCGEAFLEVVAPMHSGTAVSRFLDRPGGGAYMAIFDCSDAEARRARALAMGVRVVHELDYPGRLWGSQLHPRDGRAVMLEFDHNHGAESLAGAYWPAGPHWRDFQRLDRVRGLPLVEVQSPDVPGLAAHWSRLMAVPVQHDAQGRAGLQFDLGAVRFVPVPAGQAECLRGVQLQVADPAAVLRLAAEQGCVVDGQAFELAGVRLEPVPFT